MERLTTDRDYLVDKAQYERHLAQGYPRSTPQERFLRLCEYERTGHTPEEIAEFDNLYYAKCQEVNRLNAELAELKKQPHGDLISRSVLLTKLNDTGVQITFDLPVEEILGEDVDMDDFTMLVQDAIQAYRKMVIDAIQSQPTAYDVEKVEEQLEREFRKYYGENWDKAPYLVKTIDIVRNGGKE